MNFARKTNKGNLRYLLKGVLCTEASKYVTTSKCFFKSISWNCVVFCGRDPIERNPAGAFKIGMWLADRISTKKVFALAFEKKY